MRRIESATCSSIDLFAARRHCLFHSPLWNFTYRSSHYSVPCHSAVSPAVSVCLALELSRQDTAITVFIHHDSDHLMKQAGGWVVGSLVTEATQVRCEQRSVRAFTALRAVPSQQCPAIPCSFTTVQTTS